MKAFALLLLLISITYSLRYSETVHRSQLVHNVGSEDNKNQSILVKPSASSTPTKPQEKATNSSIDASVHPESPSVKVADPDAGANKDDPTANGWNCNSKGRCWSWCGDKDKLALAKNDFHKQADGKWCYTTSENSCKTRADCKTQGKCVDNCSARWGQ